ncbi:MAG: hypothetical protein ACYDH5_19305, partial [Acidimicrobiales bacterium]
STSMLISATRCLLAYVLLPMLTLGLGIATSVVPIIGIPVGVLALVFDVVGVRRFWVTNHPWRWRFTTIYASIMGLVSVLLVGDIQQLLR